MNRVPVEPKKAVDLEAGDFLLCRPGIQGCWFDVKLLCEFLHRQ